MANTAGKAAKKRKGAHTGVPGAGTPATGVPGAIPPAAGTLVPPSRSATRFAELVNQFKAQGPTRKPLTNFTFFLGAGFSKSWATAYPTGPALFEVPDADRDQLMYVERAAISTAPARPANLQMSDISQLVYSLDMNAKYPAIRARYTDDRNIRQSKNLLRAYFAERFQGMINPNWHWFDDQSQKFGKLANYTPEQEQIRGLFRKMFSLIDGSRGHLEGARFNFITTNYDWLVEQITDSVCENDDSAFLYLYRGITPDQVCGLPPTIPAFAHSLVFNLLKINGGLEIFRDGGRYHFNYLQRTRADYDSNAPILMLPSREQDYMDEYFLSIFPKAVRLLHESRVLVLVGYSLPPEDALLRFIIRQFCEDEADALEKTIFYVDMMLDEPVQVARLKSVFPYPGQKLEMVPHKGGFADWAGQVSQLI